MDTKKVESPGFKKLSKSSSKHKKAKKSLFEEEIIIATTSNESITKKVITPKSSKKKRRDSASSDEERWLTAIESGKLEDVDDELKKIKPKDPALMTARQRAMYERGSDGENNLLSLPTGYKEKVMTAEAIQKAQIKSLKRKQMADEKREKDKKKTMERLLKKQESKSSRDVKPRRIKSIHPSILYQQNNVLTTISFPESVDCDIKPQSYKKPPDPKYCIICGKVKKYSCSRTGAPLCSLQCYKNNICRTIV